MNLLNIGKFAAAIAIAVGAHFVTQDGTTQAIADLIALIIAQRNRAMFPTVGRNLP